MPVPTEAPRSVLICHRDAPIDQVGLSRWLASFSNLVGIVELDEPTGRTVRRIRSQIKRAGLLRFLDVLAFRAYYRLTSRAADAAWERRSVDELSRRFNAPEPGPPILRTGSVNSAECVEFLRQCGPDFVIARCKTLLRPEVFSIPRSGTYVLHPGICPEYRNAHGCFWALASGDLGRVGLTLLRIDAGVDTGPVYGYFTYPFDERTESHVRIQQRVLVENLDAIRDRLLAAVAGRVTPIDTRGRTSATWGQPWLSAQLRWKAAARARSTDDASAALPRRRAENGVADNRLPGR
jgi:folate-dependent phosphoribosylglycinamide formyltransferase PurN